MNRFLPCFVLALAAPVAAPAQQSATIGASAVVDSQLASFDLAVQRVYQSHFDSTFNGVNWLALRDSLRPRAVGAPRDTIRLLLRTMLGRLGQSHFAILPQEATEANQDGRGTGVPGFEVRLIDGAVTVMSVDSTGPAAGVVQTGWVVATVDTHQVAGLIEQVKTRPGRYPEPVRVTMAVEGWLSGDPGHPVVVGFRDGQDQLVRREITRVPASGEQVKVGDFPTFFARFYGKRLSRQGVTVGLMGFNTWMVPLMRQLDSAVAAVKPVDGMILDLRGNRGGIAAMVSGLAGHFIDQKDTLGLFRTRRMNLAYAANPRRTTPAGEPATVFAGPVAILQDELSASASEVFAGGMQSLGRVRVFGTTSLGAVLPANWAKLPNGDVLYYAIADFITNTGVVLEGVGVIPDQVVRPTRQDLLLGVDPVLEAAIQWIASQRSPSSQEGNP